MIEQSAVRTAEAAAAAAASRDAGVVEVGELEAEFPPLRRSVSTAALHPLSAAPTAACLQSALDPAAPCRISSTGAEGAAASGQSLPRTQSRTTVVGPEPSLVPAQGSSWRAYPASTVRDRKRLKRVWACAPVRKGGGVYLLVRAGQLL